MQELNTGQKIKILREQLNLTLEQVGNIVGVGKSTVRKWETGEIANMRRDKIAALAKALHTTPAYLMDWKEETDKNEPLAKGVTIPVLGYVRAGYPIYAEENIMKKYQMQWLPKASFLACVFVVSVWNLKFSRVILLLFANSQILKVVKLLLFW